MPKNKETENKMQQLQVLEQNIQNVSMQKQQFQSQLIELDSSLSEVEMAKGKTYKVIGAIMIESNKENIKKDLKDRREVVNLRIKTIEKQEDNLKEKAQSLQKEVLEGLK